MRQLKKPEQSKFLAKLLDANSDLTRSEVLAEVQRLEREISRVWKLVDEERRLSAELVQAHKKSQMELVDMIGYYRKTNEWLWKLKKTPVL